MTTVVGFRCTDGIVLAADREVSLGDILKVQRRKICWLERHEIGKRSCAVAFAGAGERDFLAYFFEKVSPRIAVGMSSQEIQDCIQETTYELYETHIYPFHRGQSPSVLQMLIGVVVQGEKPLLLKAHKSLVVKMGSFESIGAGSALAYYLADRIIHRALSTRGAKVLAANIVQKVGRYVPYCSDQIDMAVMSHDVKVDAFDPFLAGLAEAPFYIVERHIEEFLASFGEWETDEEAFEKAFSDLEKNLRDRLGFRGQPEKKT